MLDPRIYRTSLLAVVLAVIVVAFALRGQPQPLGASLVPAAFNGSNAYAQTVELAHRYAHRPAGSSQDDALANVIAGSLRTDNFAVSRSPFTADTPAGRRRLENVVAVRQGLQNSAIVVVAHRDAAGSPAVAQLSGTGVLLDLGRALSGQTLNHTLVLASTTGSTGAAGAARLAASLGRPVDAVLVLGDMAGTDLRRPLVVPWSDGQQVAPALLRDTVSATLQAQAGLNAGSPSLAAQLFHLAFPVTFTEQGPFNVRGIPAVLLSASGDNPTGAHEPVSLPYITRFGRTTLQTIETLDANARVPAPSAYLSFDGHEIPAWAVRLLVLALILPVAATALDGFARARRWSYAVARPLAWVAACAAPFLLALGIVLVARAAGFLNIAPPGAVGPGAVPLHTGSAVSLAALPVVILAAFALLWARGGIGVLTGRLSRPPMGALRGGRVRPSETVGNPGAVAGILISSCALALVVAVSDPFAALLLVPALHLWMVAMAPEARVHPAVRVALLVLGFVPPALLIAYYAVTLGFGPVALAWSGVLMLAGGQLGIPVAILICAAAGCGVSASINVLGTRRVHAKASPEPAPITVRGPVTYAGPGSLGGTASALTRTSSALRR